jgi:hypothetical protein
MAEYVSFLVREAQECADHEIAGQLDNSLIQVESSVETISNLLDLYYLKQELPTIPSLPNDSGLTIGAVDDAIAEAVGHLSTLVQGELSTSLLVELSNLTESRHFLMIDGVDNIISCLHKTLSSVAANR